MSLTIQYLYYVKNLGIAVYKDDDAKVFYDFFVKFGL